eukprot:TRINITY_DN1840_c0_g2_i1.p1 TRINITY_DN1840_c0_g2~~TRINITY_DN1840_c0_g2_i1.p1  ORF type:complete len:565 (-),score=108.89 TRINITY_DN1840_c0_g2_i1:55-1749(-)
MWRAGGVKRTVVNVAAARSVVGHPPQTTAITTPSSWRPYASSAGGVGTRPPPPSTSTPTPSTTSTTATNAQTRPNPKYEEPLVDVGATRAGPTMPWGMIGMLAVAALGGGGFYAYQNYFETPSKHHPIAVTDIQRAIELDAAARKAHPGSLGIKEEDHITAPLPSQNTETATTSPHPTSPPPVDTPQPLPTSLHIPLLTTNNPAVTVNTPDTPSNGSMHVVAVGADVVREVVEAHRVNFEQQLRSTEAKWKRRTDKQQAKREAEHHAYVEALKESHKRDIAEWEARLALEQSRIQAYKVQLEEEQQTALDEHTRAIHEEAANTLAERLSDMRTRFINELHEHQQELERQSQERHAQRLDIIRELHGQLESHKELFEEQEELAQSSLSVQKLSLALVDLTNALEQHALPFDTTIKVLRGLSSGLPMVNMAVKTIPKNVSKQGVYSYDRLRTRFDRVRKYARRAALVPPESGMLWHGLAVFMDATHIPPAAFGLQGEEALATLDKATQLLAAGDLKTAVAAVESLSGGPRAIANDWVTEANYRLSLEQAIKIIQAEVETQTSILYQ